MVGGGEILVCGILLCVSILTQDDDLLRGFDYETKS